jgi:hypothetical protein
MLSQQRSGIGDFIEARVKLDGVILILTAPDSVQPAAF